MVSLIGYNLFLSRQAQVYMDNLSNVDELILNKNLPVLGKCSPTEIDAIALILQPNSVQFADLSLFKQMDPSMLILSQNRSLIFLLPCSHFSAQPPFVSMPASVQEFRFLPQDFHRISQLAHLINFSLLLTSWTSVSVTCLEYAGFETLGTEQVNWKFCISFHLLPTLLF